MKFIAFNKNYSLKPDDGRALILGRYLGRNLFDEDDSFTNVIHPIYAMILSFVDGREYRQCISSAASVLNVSEDMIVKFIDALIDNENFVYLKSSIGISTFPPYTIKTISAENIDRRYKPDSFVYNTIDLRMKRHYTPSVITLMLNNICATNCVYCYQDKRVITRCTIPLERIKDIIHEAHKLNVVTFDVIGGEFFLYEYWEVVLSELRNYGFEPFLSTKMPISEDCVKTLDRLKVHDIQISLDTLLESHLISSIGVTKGYCKKMLDSLRLLECYKIPVMIHTVLTKYNDSLEDMASIYNELKKLSNIQSWHIVKGDQSLYSKHDYNKIEIAEGSISKLAKYFNEIKDESYFKITFPESTAKTNSKRKEVSNNSVSGLSEAELAFFSRSLCSGLFSSIYILPNGDVTICEQLYWNRQFIIGNVIRQSLLEVWNSPKAMSIYNVKQEDIPADSKCHSCDKFNVCRDIRQVCYREIIRKYGADKWYYPDVNCPY